MKIIDKIVVSNEAPAARNVVWAKPVGSGILMSILEGGSWKRQSNVSLEVTDITAIKGSDLDMLNVGDMVAKKTGKQKHLYTVSYKGEGVGEGICLTYVAAGLVETVSYDFTVNGWVYNSTDKCTLTVDD